MKKLLSIILSILILGSCLVIPMFNATADTLDAYTGDSWNTFHRSLKNTKLYTRTLTWTDSTMSSSTTTSGNCFAYYTTPADIDLKGSYFEVAGVNVLEGTYEVSTSVTSNMTKTHLEFYDSTGALIGQTGAMDSSRVTSGTITFASDMIVTIKVVAESSSTNGTRYRLGGGDVKFVPASAPEWTSRHFDASRSFAGTSTGTFTNGSTGAGSLATVDHENCLIDTGSHTAHGVRGLNVDDYVYYKFTDVPAGTYNITDYYYDVSSGAAKWDVYVGNSVEALTRVNGLTSCGSNSVKTLETENVTVDTTGILIYAVKFTEGTANNCRTVHFCFDLEQTSTTGEPLETESTVPTEETTTTTTTTTGDVIVPETDGETTDLVSTNEGASIRLNDVNGMRFYATLTGEASDVDEMGFIIAPKDIVEGMYFTMDDDHIKVVYDHWKFNLWEGNQFVGSIVNIADKNLARDFIARAYVVIDGETYYAKQTTVRNLAGVADAYIADANGGYAELPEDKKALVDKWAKAND